jgi:AcrR family transcriptional regulator
VTQLHEMPEPLTRRDRVRAATTQEIMATARRILAEQGAQAISLRAIAREMGMTAPALYRYFDSHEVLMRNVCAEIFTELGADIKQAIADAVPPTATAAPDEQPGGETRQQTEAKLTLKMVAACRAFRHWSLDHKGEFGLVFGIPLPGLDDGRWDVADECALEFAGTFFTLYLELWNTLHFPVLSQDEIDPRFLIQLTRYRDALGTDLPIGTVLTFLRCWTLLYGGVSMEVFGHLDFALADAAPMFEYTLGELATLVGLRYPG